MSEELKQNEVPVENPAPEDTELPESQEPVIERVKVKMNNVNVRKKASTSSDSLGKANKDEVYEVKGREQDSSGKTWVKIEYKGKTGYIRSDYLIEVTE